MACLLVAAGQLPAQMGKRWVDQYSGTVFAEREPAVGSRVPDLHLFDLDGRPRSLAVERGRTVVLIAGSYT
jgi:hypothetical protein